LRIIFIGLLIDKRKAESEELNILILTRKMKMLTSKMKSLNDILSFLIDGSFFQITKPLFVSSQFLISGKMYIETFFSLLLFICDEAFLSLTYFV
jgi:hypothetical protein